MSAPGGSSVSSWVRIALLLSSTTGLRRGEVCAVRWSAIEGNKLRVTASLQRINGELRFVDPKMDRARRTITLPPVTIEALRTWRKEQNERRLLAGAAWDQADIVVDRGDGRPVDPSELSRAFARLMTEIGLPSVRLHDLRHAVATELLRAGVPPKVVSEALGHASTAFTMDVYSHVMPSMGDAVADAMEAAIGGITGSGENTSGAKRGPKPF
jgi:integrase